MPLGPVKNAVSDGPANVTLTTTSETIVCTISGADVTQEGDQVIIEGFAQVTTGAGTTSLQLRVRRGTTLSGPQVGQTAQQTCTAAAPAQIGIQVDDVPPESSNLSYVLTVQQVGATGNGTAVWSNGQLTF